jgi:hypothetical protein
MRLRRCVSYREPAGFAIGWCEDIEDVSAAVWWTSREGRYADHGQRKLDGEIHLLKNLKPTSAMAHFAVDVCRWVSSPLPSLTCVTGLVCGGGDALRTSCVCIRRHRYFGQGTS